MRIYFYTAFLGLSLSLTPILGNSAGSKSLSAQDAYRSVVNKIISNDDCFSDDITLRKPNLLDDNEQENQTYSTRFSNDIFVDFYADHDVVNGAAITSTPPPKGINNISRFICIAAAIQSTIDSSKSISEFKKINYKKLSSLPSDNRNQYQSNEFEHEYYADSSTETVIRVDKKTSE